MQFFLYRDTMLPHLLHDFQHIIGYAPISSKYYHRIEHLQQNTVNIIDLIN